MFIIQDIPELSLWWSVLINFPPQHASSTVCLLQSVIYLIYQNYFQQTPENVLEFPALRCGKAKIYNERSFDEDKLS